MFIIDRDTSKKIHTLIMTILPYARNDAFDLCSVQAFLKDRYACMLDQISVPIQQAHRERIHQSIPTLEGQRAPGWQVCGIHVIEKAHGVGFIEKFAQGFMIFTVNQITLDLQDITRLNGDWLTRDHSICKTQRYIGCESFFVLNQSSAQGQSHAGKDIVILAPDRTDHSTGNNQIEIELLSGLRHGAGGMVSLCRKRLWRGKH